MKAIELRIGSTYNSVKFNIPVTLTAEDIWELVERAEGASISHYIDDMFKPIELSEQWLRDFGFTVKENNMQIDKIECTLQIDEKTWFSSCGGVEGGLAVLCLCGGNYFAKNLHYVHLLQNLYFALTGEELTKTKQP